MSFYSQWKIRTRWGFRGPGHLICWSRSVLCETRIGLCFLGVSNPVFVCAGAWFGEGKRQIVLGICIFINIRATKCFCRRNCLPMTMPRSIGEQSGPLKKHHIWSAGPDFRARKFTCYRKDFLMASIHCTRFHCKSRIVWFCEFRTLPVFSTAPMNHASTKSSNRVCTFWLFKA